MASTIDPTLSGNMSTGVTVEKAQLQAQFQAAKDDIEALQDGSGFDATLDLGTGDWRTGGQIILDIDGSAVNADGSLTLGASQDGGIFHDGSNLTIMTDVASTGIVLDAESDVIVIKGSGTAIATFNTGGLDLASGDAYEINSTVVLNATTLGTAVVTSSLTTVGALASGSIASGFGNIDNGTSDIRSGGTWLVDVDGTALNADGAISFGAGADFGFYFDGTNGIILSDGVGAGGIIIDSEDDTLEIKGSGTLQATFDTSGLDLVTGDVYQINGNTVLSATDLGAAVVTSSLTTVGTLNSGGISSGFGNIDVGTSTIDTAGKLLISADGTAVDAVGAITLGASADVALYWDGSNWINDLGAAGSYYVQKTDLPARMYLRNTVATPAADVEMGAVVFEGEDSGGGDTPYGAMRAYVTDDTATSETSYLTFETMTAGTLTEQMRIDNAGNVGIGLTPTANMTGLALEGGALTLKEITTPTADTNYGKLYTKSDNALYFQDGAGVEHTVTIS